MLNRFYLRNKNTLFPAGTEQGNFIVICCVSFIVHGLFFMAIFLLYDFDFSKPVPRAIQVDLVSFVPGPAGGKADSSIAELKDKAFVGPDNVQSESIKVPVDSVKVIAKSAKTAPKPLAILKPDISLKTKPKNLKELMADQKKKKKQPPKPTKKLKAKPKVDPEKALKKARKEIAKKVEDQNQKQISDALSRLQAEIKTRENENNTLGPGGEGAGTGVGKQGYSPMDLYKISLKYAIEQNWVFNDMLARLDNRLEVRVMIKILKSGEIRDVAFETKSGNRYLDESAKKAIKRANPLPKLPMGMKSWDVVVSFTPKGLK